MFLRSIGKFKSEINQKVEVKNFFAWRNVGSARQIDSIHGKEIPGLWTVMIVINYSKTMMIMYPLMGIWKSFISIGRLMNNILEFKSLRMIKRSSSANNIILKSWGIARERRNKTTHATFFDSDNELFVKCEILMIINYARNVSWTTWDLPSWSLKKILRS